MSVTACMLRSASGSRSALRPRLGVQRAVRLPLELGEHPLGDQLVAALGGLGVGPLVGERHVAAEAAGLLLQPLDLLARHVGRADRAEPGVVDEVDHLPRRVGLADGHLREGGGVLEVVEPLADAVLDVLGRLLLRLGDVHQPDEAPLRAVGDGAERLGTLLHDIPVQAERVEPGRLGGADRQQADAVLAGQARAARRRHGRHGDVEQRVRVRAQVQPGVGEAPHLRLARHRLVGGEQAHDDVEPLLQQRAGLGRVEPEHDGVGRQGAGTDAEHEPAPRHVVELHGPLGDHVRVVVGDADDARAELDVLGPLGRGGDEDLRAGDDLRAGRVVLADPRLVPAEPVEVLDQLEVAFDGERRVLAGLVERRHEDAEAESVGHRSPLLSVCRRRPPSM